MISRSAIFHHEEFSTGKKMVSQNSPTSSCWAFIVTGKEANFFPFHCKFLHEFNQLSNKKTLPWGKREKKEVILLWSWEVEDEQENKVQRKTTFEIWLLFQRSCGLEEERSGFVWREDSPKYLSELLLSVWCLYESYFCEVVVDGILSLEANHQCCLYCFLSLRWRFAPILPENSVLIFRNQFHLCQFIFQRLLFPFQQIKSQKQSRSYQWQIGGNLRTSW